VVITTELLEDGTGAARGPAMVVAVRPFRDEDDPATVHHALGSVLAHELRTPMTTIFGGAQLVSDPRVSGTTRNEAAKSVERWLHGPSATRTIRRPSTTRSDRCWPTSYGRRSRRSSAAPSSSVIPVCPRRPEPRPRSRSSARRST